MESLRQNY